MSELNLIKDDVYRNILKEGIENRPSDKQYVALHVSSAHMSIFCEYYNTTDEIKEEKGNELITPQCYSKITIIWDCHENKLLYYDLIGLTYSAFDRWHAHHNYK